MMAAYHTIDDHRAQPGPQHWDWRCLTCGAPVQFHAPWWVRWYRRRRG